MNFIVNKILNMTMYMIHGPSKSVLKNCVFKQKLRPHKLSLWRTGFPCHVISLQDLTIFVPLLEPIMTLRDKRKSVQAWIIYFYFDRQRSHSVAFRYTQCTHSAMVGTTLSIRKKNTFLQAYGISPSKKLSQSSEVYCDACCLFLHSARRRILD